MTEFTNCLSVLAGENTYGNITDFDQGNGQIYIIESKDCWADVSGDIENQLAYAEIGLQALEALHYPTDAIREQMKGIEAVRNYSKGIMLFTSYQWDEAKLENDDQVGLCFYQNSGSASCWGYTYGGNGTYTAKDSYLLNPSEIASNTTLDSFAQVDASFPSGTEGHWFLSDPETAFETTKKVFAARFSPESNSEADPSIKTGSADIVTYQASRTTPDTPSEETLLATDHKMLQQSNSFGSSFRWQVYQVDLLCYSEANCTYVPPSTGATAVTTVGTLLAACVALLSF